MNKWKIIYAIILLIAIVAYFMPWQIGGDGSFSGFNTLITVIKMGALIRLGLLWPLQLFLFSYIFGLIIGVIVLFTEYKAVGLSIFAGILMIINIFIFALSTGLARSLGSYIPGHYDPPQFVLGFFLAAFISLVYVILGPIAARKFKKT